jgi:response regulator RpfG family c-di-GMP phosphodiesterase
MELRNYLRHLPGSNYYLDRREDVHKAQFSLEVEGVPYVHREELKVMQGMLAWVAFLTKELETPIAEIKDWLDSLPRDQVGKFDSQQPGGLKPIQESISQLLHIMKELENMKRVDWVADSITLDEVDLRESLDWVIEQMQRLAEQQGVAVDIEGVNNSRLMVDGKSLTQSLFYLLRSEIESSAHGDRVLIRVPEPSETFITIEIINRNRYIPPGELAMLFRGELESMINSGRRNDLYLAQVLVHGFGGKLQVESQEVEGTVFKILVPKKWQSLVEQINHLQSAVEASSKAAQGQLENINYLLSAALEQVPPAVEEGLESASSKIQELEVLCNRSLFLADDLASELERGEGRLLRQEVEQLTTSDVVLVLSREIARIAQVASLFDSESCQRVTRHTLAIAAQFKLSRSKQRTLYYAALLKDLSLASAPRETLEQMFALTPEKAESFRESFNRVREALSRLNFLAPALSLISRMHERYDGTGYPTGVRGAKIPLGAKILAIVNAFDALTSGFSTKETMDPEAAAKEIAAGSGQRFDPQVVSVFLQTWRKEKISIK